MRCFTYPVLTVCLLLLASCAPGHSANREMVVGEGKVSVLNTHRLLIEEKVSVVALDLDRASGEFLASRYKPGQAVTLLGFKTIDEEGNSSSRITAIVFEDGRRFNIIV